MKRQKAKTEIKQAVQDQILDFANECVGLWIDDNSDWSDEEKTEAQKQLKKQINRTGKIFGFTQWRKE